MRDVPMNVAVRKYDDCLIIGKLKLRCLWHFLMGVECQRLTSVIEVTDERKAALYKGE